MFNANAIAQRKRALDADRTHGRNVYFQTQGEKHMKIVEIKDYAYPCMMAERAVKNVYELMLKNDTDKAIEQCNIAIEEIKNILNAIKK